MEIRPAATKHRAQADAHTAPLVCHFDEHQVLAEIMHHLQSGHCVPYWQMSHELGFSVPL